MPIDRIDPNQEAQPEQLPEAQRTAWAMRHFISEADRARGVLKTNAAVAIEIYQRLLGEPALTFDALESAMVEERAKRPQQSTTDFAVAAEAIPADERSKWWQIVNFAGHDIRHIGETEIIEHAKQVAWAMYVARNEKSDYDKTAFEADFQAIYQEVLQELPEILAQMEAPHQFLKALAELELGQEPSEVAKVDLAKLAHVIARTIQLRFVWDDYVLVDSQSRQPERNEIILDLGPSSLETNPGMIWSVIYNLIKNAAKELACDRRGGRENFSLDARIVRGKLPDKPSKLWVKTEELPRQGVTLIHVGDSGEGLKLDEIMASIKWVIQKGLLKESGLKRSMQRILEDWRKNPFAVRALKMGDVFDLAGVARTSGFVTRERLSGQQSSGMGLWGVNYLIEKMGGEIIYTNTVDGGAVFTVIIPNKYFEKESGQGAIRKATRLTRRAIERGEIPVKLPEAA